MTERPLLLTLALGNFVLGTGAFVLPALLQPMAADLGVSLSAAGWLMSGYALAYALASPLLTAWTGAWPRRRVLLAGLALIAVGNAALAVAPDLLAAPASTMRQLTTLLRDPGAALALSVTLFFFAGQFVVVTFLGPVVTSAAGVGGGGLSLLLWLFGLAAFAANLLDGALADRVGPAPTIAGLTAASALVLADLPVLDAQPWPAALCLVLWGLTGFAFMTPQQSRLVALTPWAQGLALSLNASALCAGSAAGGAVGGAIVAAAGLAPLGLGGAALLAVSLQLLAASCRLKPTAPPPSTPVQA